MNRIHLSLRSFLASLSDASLVCAAMGRLLISSIGIFLPLMLWTEHITSFDRFFQGGQDCEMSLLALLAFLCMVILLAIRSRQSIIVRLTVLKFLALVSQAGSRDLNFLQGLSSFFPGDTPSPFPAGTSPMPLRI